MVEYNLAKARGNLLPSRMIFSFRLIARGILYALSHRQDRVLHTTTFLAQIVEHWLEQDTTMTRRKMGGHSTITSSIPNYSSQLGCNVLIQSMLL